MKKIILARHAKSDWQNDLSDFARPLNKRGQRDAPKMGIYLAKNYPKPSLIISSPANRALTTAKIIAKAFNYSEQDIIKNEHIYLASVDSLVNIIQNFDDKVNDIMLFGHNPGITLLSTYFTRVFIDNVPTCGILGINFNVGKWSEIEKGCGELEFFKYPKNLNN
jgi:phosphohistidine phosphatase